MEKVLEPYNLPRLKHEKIENLNILITSEEIESVMKNLPIKKSPGPDSFIGEFHQAFKELILILLKLFQQIEEAGILPNKFYEDIITLIAKPKKDTIRTENYRPISLMKVDTNILNNILANQNLQHIKRIMHHN